MNTTANQCIVNDIDNNLNDLYKLFRNAEPDFIINHIKKRIDEYGLAKERTKRNEYHDVEQINKYKTAYMSFRDHYNKTRNIFDFYTLMFYSFSQQFRFNSKGEFNMPCGNDCFAPKNEEYIRNGCEFFHKPNVRIAMIDFRGLFANFLHSSEELNDTFFYCDPPYLNTTAVYNENNGWNENDEKDLYRYLDDLDSRGAKWALSSVKSNKGKTNELLVDWLDKHNNYNEYSFDGFTYMACGKGNSNAKEILVTNY
jgi:site-specific DNA-adenine methylase